jgi:hypothetical protein
MAQLVHESCALMDRYDLLIFIGLGFAFGLLVPRGCNQSGNKRNRIENALHEQRWSYLNN